MFIGDKPRPALYKGNGMIVTVITVYCFAHVHLSVIAYHNEIFSA